MTKIARRTEDQYYMRRALSLARRGTGLTSPNPRVGCVLVRDGAVVGEGYHARCGEDHAEVAAIKDAVSRGESPRGATAYVTLEPCAHFGRTPPCAPRLVEEGIARVVVGMVDPNPKVHSLGLEILRRGGVEVSVPCLAAECKWLNRGFIRAQTMRRPWVTLKAAAGLDGTMALLNGESKWITCEQSRRLAHLMRAEHDAVLVGAGTVLADDPELTVRHTCGRSPLRVVLDSRLSIAPTAKVLRGGNCLIFTCGGDEAKKAALEAAGARVLTTAANAEGHVDLQAVLAALCGEGVLLLMVEGGPLVLSSFMKEGLGDALALFTAPAMLGAGHGVSCGLSFDTMEDVVRFKSFASCRSGADLLWKGIFECSPDL